MRVLVTPSGAPAEERMPGAGCRVPGAGGATETSHCDIFSAPFLSHFAGSPEKPIPNPFWNQALTKKTVSGMHFAISRRKGTNARNEGSEK